MTKPKTKKRALDRDPGAPPPRDRTVHARLTEQEERNMRAAAKAADMSPSVFVRACLHYVLSRGITP